MAVGFVASASSGSQASVASFNIGTLGTGARAGIVFVCIHNSGTDIISGVTWNGAPMSLLYKATDTDSEPGVVKAYFLDNVTNGTITVSRTNNTVVTVGYAASISASGACEAFRTITHVNGTQNTNADTSAGGTGASGEIAIDDGSPGTNSMRFAAGYSGAATPPAQGTNSTALQVLDSTAFGSRFVRETNAGQGSRNVGFATGTTDDWAVVAVAVRERVFITGTGAGTGAAGTASGTGIEKFTGTGAGTGAAGTATGTGIEKFTGTGAGTGAAGTASGSGDVESTGASGTGAGIQAAPTASGTAAETMTGTGTGTQAASTGSGAATETFSGFGSGVGAAGTASGAGTETFTGTGAGAGVPASSAGSGVETFTGTGAGTGAAATASGTGAQTFSGTGAGVQAAASASGSGVETFTGAGAGAQAKATASGSGLHVIPVTGTGAGMQAPATGSGSGLHSQSVTGTGAGVQAPQSGWSPDAVHPVFPVGGYLTPEEIRRMQDRPRDVRGTGKGGQPAPSAIGYGFVDDAVVAFGQLVGAL